MTTTTTSLVTETHNCTYSGFPGDACDDGFDRDLDGIPDKNDNCPDSDNADQLDADEDGVGDDCDPDADNDGIPNLEDNCPLIANPEQMDDDHDGTGDACFRNYDGDGVPDEFDTCPRNAKIDTTGEICFFPTRTTQLPDFRAIHPIAMGENTWGQARVLLE